MLAAEAAPLAAYAAGWKRTVDNVFVMGFNVEAHV